MIRSSIRIHTGRSAACIVVLAAALLLALARSAAADGDLVAKRTRLPHPSTPPVAAPTPTPGRDVVRIDPVPSPRPPRIPGELAPVAASPESELASSHRLQALFEALWRAFGR